MESLDQQFFHKSQSAGPEKPFQPRSIKTTYTTAPAKSRAGRLPGESGMIEALAGPLGGVRRDRAYSRIKTDERGTGSGSRYQTASQKADRWQSVSDDSEVDFDRPPGASVIRKKQKDKDVVTDTSKDTQQNKHKRKGTNAEQTHSAAAVNLCSDGDSLPRTPPKKSKAAGRNAGGVDGSDRDFPLGVKSLLQMESPEEQQRLKLARELQREQEREREWQREKRIKSPQLAKAKTNPNVIRKRNQAAVRDEPVASTSKAKAKAKAKEPVMQKRKEAKSGATAGRADKLVDSDVDSPLGPKPIKARPKAKIIQASRPAAAAPESPVRERINGATKAVFRSTARTKSDDVGGPASDANFDPDSDGSVLEEIVAPQLPFQKIALGRHSSPADIGDASDGTGALVASPCSKANRANRAARRHPSFGNMSIGDDSDDEALPPIEIPRFGAQKSTTFKRDADMDDMSDFEMAGSSPARRNLSQGSSRSRRAAASGSTATSSGSRKLRPAAFPMTFQPLHKRSSVMTPSPPRGVLRASNRVPESDVEMSSHDEGGVNLASPSRASSSSLEEVDRDWPADAPIQPLLTGSKAERECSYYISETHRCEYCLEPLPLRPSDKLEALLNQLRDARKGSTSRKNGDDLAWTRAIDTCAQHRAETRTIPLGEKAGYPKGLNPAEMRKRINEKDFRIDLLRIADHPTESPYFLLVQRDIEEAGGKRRWMSDENNLLALNSRLQPGYYGTTGREIMIRTVEKLISKRPQMADITPLTLTEFIGHVLVPEVATRLVQQDLGTAGAGRRGRTLALKILKESVAYGLARFGNSAAAHTISSNPRSASPLLPSNNIVDVDDSGEVQEWDHSHGDDVLLLSESQPDNRWEAGQQVSAGPSKTLLRVEDGPARRARDPSPAEEDEIDELALGSDNYDAVNFAEIDEINREAAARKSNASKPNPTEAVVLSSDDDDDRPTARRSSGHDRRRPSNTSAAGKQFKPPSASTFPLRPAGSASNSGKTLGMKRARGLPPPRPVEPMWEP